MRIALISYEFPPHSLGGIGTYASHTTRMLAARGHDVTVFSSTSEKYPHQDAIANIKVLRVPTTNRQTFHLPAVSALVDANATTPFDIAEIPDLFAEGYGLRARLPKLPIVLRAHTPSYIAHEVDFLSTPRSVRSLSAIRRLLGGVANGERWSDVWKSARARVRFPGLSDHEREVAFDSDLVSPPSQALAKRLEIDWDLPRAKIRVVPYTHIPSPALVALPPPRQARTISFHGGVRKYKGVHVLVDAMKQVTARHPETELVLAGASGVSPVPSVTFSAWWNDRMIEWRDTVEWLRPRLDALGNRIRIKGFVQPENIEEYLSEADICVFPSLFDNFPSACLEAMSAARPIVATRSGGMEEMLGDEEAGLLVPPGDARALANAICRLIESPALRVKLASRAREKLILTYNSATVGPRTESLFAEAIELGRRRRLARPSLN